MGEEAPAAEGNPVPLAKRRPSALRLDTGKVSSEVNVRSSVSKASDASARSLDEYDLLKALGQGTTGVVYEAQHKDSGQRVALKVMRLDDEELLESARQEFELLRGLQHPHIIQAVDFFTYRKGAVLVLEHFPGSTTLDVAVQGAPEHRLDERSAQRLFCALLRAVHHLHQQGIVHRDVKAQNILVSADLSDLRLVDFNTARHLADGALTMTGTADYLPPEVLLGNSLTEGSDVWAMGICLHLMVTGALPLKRKGFASHEDFGRTLMDGLSASRVDVDSLGLSVGCLEVLRACLTIELEERPGAVALLEFAWLADAAALI